MGSCDSHPAPFRHFDVICCSVGARVILLFLPSFVEERGVCRKYRTRARRKYWDRARRLSVFLSGVVDGHGRDVALHVAGDVLAFRVLVLEEHGTCGHPRTLYAGKGAVFVHFDGVDEDSPGPAAYPHSVHFEPLAAGECGRRREVRRSRRSYDRVLADLSRRAYPTATCYTSCNNPCYTILRRRPLKQCEQIEGKEGHFVSVYVLHLVSNK